MFKQNSLNLFCSGEETVSEIWRNTDVNQKKTRRKIKIQEKEKILPNTKNDSHLSNLGNDIVVSSSGRVRIDHLDSCLELDDGDFIVY